MKKDIYIMGIGGIGVSAIARYYLYEGYNVFGNDKIYSELTKKLEQEGVIISSLENTIKNNNLDLIVYTEAIPEDNKELILAKKTKTKILTYPEALASIVNDKKLISIAGTHGKSTTTSLISLVLKDSEEGVNAIVGTILKEFGGKNTYFSDSQFFAIEACEYKRSFLKYKPLVAIITNIELDHLDYYKDLDDYISAFKEYINNVIPGGFAIINAEDVNCRKLIGLRDDINYIEVYSGYFMYNNEMMTYPKIDMKIPGEHILFDAHLAYIVGHMLAIKDEHIISSLENYNGVWRRMELIGDTENKNTLISDYGHHPTEIRLTLKALKDKSPARPILTIFQPHQYSRTIELIEDFKTCFYDTDKLIIPNIYESRDNEKDKNNMSSKILIEAIKHDNKVDGESFENTLRLINSWDKENKYGLILLLGAGDIDDLRTKIKTA